jgi:alpha-ribazole phosphatase
MNIFLLRHGETKENKNKTYYGKLDSELNEAGIAQAKNAGKLLKGIEFDSVYISERQRTKKTAEIALDKSGLNFVVDSRINEISFGAFEGKDYKEIQEKFPKETELWDKDWKGFQPPSGESYLEFYDRIKSFMDDIIKKQEENILIVTHGGVIRTIYCYVLGGNMDLYWKFASRNGDVSIIKYEFGNLFIDSITHAVDM